MNSLSRSKIVFATFLLCLFTATPSWSADYDLVVLQGRVIDPETKLDQIKNIGISGGMIKQVTSDSISGKTSIDATGQVVAPGFIDIHSHTPTLLGQHMNLLDGVTTQLDLEAGAFPISAYGEHYQGGAQLHYGSSVGHFAIRTKVMEGIDQAYIFSKGKMAKFGGAATTKQANSTQIAEMRELLNQGIDQGGLGIGVLLDYITTAVTEQELLMLFEVASQRAVPLFIHVRRGYTGDPTGLVEVIELAKQHQAAMLVCHITHLAMGRIDEWLAMIDQANSEGANITTETLSYAAGGTSISADVFKNRDWRKIFDIDYADVQWVATGEWLSKETWDKYAKEQPRGMINHHYVKEAWVESALQWPGMMVSTDALPAFDLDVFSNPNIAGTFSRVLGHYVRDANVLGLSEGLSKLSLKQAQWMQQASPAFSKKGRIQVGMDADLVIFDAATVAANATYGDPYQAPTGINHVIVAGRQIVIDGERIEGRYPGRKILGSAAIKAD
jgi:N-acyl-D-aspartate/D-glutamate deacylase